MGAGFFLRDEEWKKEGGTGALLLIYHCTVTTTNFSIPGVSTVPGSPLTNLPALGLLRLVHISPQGLDTTPLYFKYDIMENGAGISNGL